MSYILFILLFWKLCRLRCLQRIDLGFIINMETPSQSSSSKLNQKLQLRPQAYVVPSQWESYREIIKSLYLDRNKALEEVKRIMATDHGFHATQVTHDTLCKRRFSHDAGRACTRKESKPGVSIRNSKSTRSWRYSIGNRKGTRLVNSPSLSLEAGMWISKESVVMWRANQMSCLNWKEFTKGSHLGKLFVGRRRRRRCRLLCLLHRRFANSKRS